MAGYKAVFSVSGDKGKSTSPKLAFGPHRLSEVPSRLLSNIRNVLCLFGVFSEL